MTAAERSRSLRYKRPMLQNLGYSEMVNELYEIQEACTDVSYFVEHDEDTLLNALDGNEDEAWEFKMAFSDLSAKCELLMYAFGENTLRDVEYDDCLVALIGNRYTMYGYDGLEEDYFSLTRYEADLAYTDAGKRIMRLTKSEMLSTIGQALGVLVSFLDLQQRYYYLKATMDILRDENTSMLKQIRAVETAYESAADVGFLSWSEEVRYFDKLLSYLPDRAWVE